MKYAHYSSRYISYGAYDPDYSEIYTLSRLERWFNDLKTKRLEIYTDFFTWIDFLIENDLIAPI